MFLGMNRLWHLNLISLALVDFNMSNVKVKYRSV